MLSPLLTAFGEGTSARYRAVGASLSRPPVLDAVGHMALDEAVLLESPLEALVLRVYEWKGEACTFGFSQTYVDARAACKKGIEPVRRATGGGIVFHDGDVTFSLVFPWDKTSAPETIYKNIHRAVHLGLKSAGASTFLYSPPAKPAGLAPNCFSRPERMDLVLPDNSKVLGGALRKKGPKGLYQGSLRPEGLGLPVDSLKAAVLDGISREFGASSLDIRRDWLDAGRGLEARYRSAEWNERR